MILSILKQYYKSIIIGVLIVWLSLSGGNSLITTKILDIPYLDKIGHFSMYALFSSVLLLDSCRWREDIKFYLPILLLPLIFGATMEYLQMTLTSVRKAEMLDMAANIGGVTTGLIVAYIARRVLTVIRS